MRLAVHFQGLPGDLRDKVQSSNMGYVKLIDPPSDNPFPGKKVIGRTFMDDNEANALVNQGAEGAQIWFGRFLPFYKKSSYIWAWEGPNEPQPISDYGFRVNLNLFTDALADLMHGESLRFVGLNLGVGGPDVGHAKDFPCVANCDYLGLHEYSARAMWDGVGWYCLRYRRTLAELEAAHIAIPPVLIGECGIDGGVLIPGQRTGWRTFCQPTNGKSAEEVYEEQLAWYDSELQKDGSAVAAAFIFTAGANYDWIDFDLNPTLVNWLAAKSWEVEVPVSPPVNPPAEPPIVVVPPVNPSIPAIVNLVGKLAVHPTKRYDTRTTWKYAVIHHSATPTVDSIPSLLRVKRIAHYHVSRYGWPGIGYTYAIAQDGTVYQTNDETAISYHAGTKKGNREGVGICLLGTYTKTQPPAVQITSLENLLDWLNLPVKPHSDFVKTACPGAWYKAWASGIR